MKTYTRGFDQLIDIELTDDFGQPISFDECEEVVVEVSVNAKSVYSASKSSNSLKPKSGLENACYFIIDKNESSSWNSGFAYMTVSITRHNAEVNSSLTTGDREFLFEVL